MQRYRLGGGEHEVEGVPVDGEDERMAHAVRGPRGAPVADEHVEPLGRRSADVVRVEALRHAVAAGVQVGGRGMGDDALFEQQVRRDAQQAQLRRRVGLEEGELEGEFATVGGLEVADPVPPLDRGGVRRVVARQLDRGDRVGLVVDAGHAAGEPGSGEEQDDDAVHARSVSLEHRSKRGLTQVESSSCWDHEQLGAVELERVRSALAGLDAAPLTLDAYLGG